jgi:hypothetical protein
MAIFHLGSERAKSIGMQTLGLTKGITADPVGTPEKTQISLMLEHLYPATQIVGPHAK